MVDAEGHASTASPQHCACIGVADAGVEVIGLPGVSLRATCLVHSRAPANFDASTAISLDRSSELGRSTDYMEEAHPVILPVTSIEI